MSGTLYIVATPIGNLGDMSYRAVETLKTVDFIAAEDTRVTLKLLRHFDIRRELVSYHEHNKRESGSRIISRLLAGETCALVSDAGMPAVSDPGEELIAECHNTGIPVRIIPGPCAVSSAAALCGFTGGRFAFEGFLSSAKNQRIKRLESIKSDTRAMIFYEAPHKLRRTLSDMLKVFGDRKAAILRELTKIYEETRITTISSALADCDINPPRGEYVIVVSGAADDSEPKDTIPAIESAVEMANDIINRGTSMKEACRIVSDALSIPKNRIYQALIAHGKVQE